MKACSRRSQACARWASRQAHAARGSARERRRNAPVDHRLRPAALPQLAAAEPRRCDAGAQRQTRFSARPSTATIKPRRARAPGAVAKRAAAAPGGARHRRPRLANRSERFGLEGGCRCSASPRFLAGAQPVPRRRTVRCAAQIDTLRDAARCCSNRLRCAAPARRLAPIGAAASRAARTARPHRLAADAAECSGAGTLGMTNVAIGSTWRAPAHRRHAAPARHRDLISGLSSSSVSTSPGSRRN
jgi:hypothetical protein